MDANDVAASHTRLTKATTRIFETRRSEAIMALNDGKGPPEYYYQRHYGKCSHTINRFGWCNNELYDQFKEGRMPFLRLNDFCSDCKSRQELAGNNLDEHTTILRAQINGYAIKLDEFSRRMSKQAAELQQLRLKSTEDGAELKRLHYVLHDQTTKVNLQVLARQRMEKEKNAEIEKLMASLKASEAEAEKQKSIAYRQEMELGDLRKKVKQPAATINPITANLVNKTPFAETRYGKEVLKMATIGFITPILSGFTNLKGELTEHKWSPFVGSLFTELQEAVRRNSWEDICEIRDRMQTFAEAFDNDFKEKVEKAEKEIVEQCKTGLQHVLSRWCSDNRIC
jgi:hypothetical protein